VLAQSQVTLSGKIRPQNVTGVAATVDGFLDAFLVDVGEEVFEGQVLARIGSQGLEADRQLAAAAVESAQDQVSKAEAAITAARLEASRADANAERARAALDRAESAYSRQRMLFGEGATPRLTYEKSLREYEGAQKEFAIMDKAARAAAERVRSLLQELAAAKKLLADKTEQLDQAQTALEAADVHSPVGGLVVGRKGEVGGPVQELGDQFFQIATDLYALEVAVEPPPAVLKRLHPGQEALVLIPDLQSAGFPGAVKEIRDGEVIVEFNSTMPAIRPGMLADVRLKLE